MKSLRILPLALVISLALMIGCATPTRVAHRMITAPNQQSTPPTRAIVDAWSKNISGQHNPFRFHTITVGPPQAELALAELPPGRYDFDLSTHHHPGTNEAGELHFKFTFRSESPVEPVPKERGTLFLLHGYIVSREVLYPWAFLLAREGFRVIAVDIRGHGQSTGGQVSFGKWESADLVQALDQLQAGGIVREPVGVLGVSLGANVALHWAARDARVRSVVAIAPYNRPEDAFRRFARAMNLPVREAAITEALEIAARQLNLQWCDWSGEAALHQLQIPVYFIGGAHDSISPPEDLQYLHRLAPPGSELRMIPEANHDTIALWLHEISHPALDWLLDALASGSPRTQVDHSLPAATTR